MLKYAKDFTSITINQYTKIKCILMIYPKLLISSDLMKINRSISYISFFLKDIFEYADSKGPDNTNLTLVRNADEELVKYQAELEKLDTVLKDHL